MKEGNNVRSYEAKLCCIYVLTIQHFEGNGKILNFCCWERCQIQHVWIQFVRKVDTYQESTVFKCHRFVKRQLFFVSHQCFFKLYKKQSMFNWSSSQKGMISEYFYNYRFLRNNCCESQNEKLLIKHIWQINMWVRFVSENQIMHYNTVSRSIDKQSDWPTKINPLVILSVYSTKLGKRGRAIKH